MADTGGSVFWGGTEFHYSGKHRHNWLWIIYRDDKTIYHYGWASKRVDARQRAEAYMSFPEGEKWHKDYIGEPGNPIAELIAERAKREGISEQEAVDQHNKEREQSLNGRTIELVSLRANVKSIDFPF